MAYDYIPYIVIEIYCILFTVVILFQLTSSLGSEHEIKQLKNMIYTFLILLVSDMLWALTEGGIVSPPFFVRNIVDAATVLSISFGCYFWYRLVEDRLHPTATFSKTYRYLINTPIVIVCVLDAVSIFTGLLFSTTPDGHYQETDLFIIQSVINMFYAIIPTLNSLYRAFKTRSRVRRSEYAVYAAYILAPITAAMLEEVLYQIPVIELNVFLVILLLFLTMQNMQIFNDALTGLNNRRRLDHYLDDRIGSASHEHPIILFMLDINRFKSINDTYGHIEGDNALRAFSSALRLVAGRYDAFIARYGGDEFCMVTEMPTEHLELLEADILDTLQNALDTVTPDQTPYTITTSIGYAVCDQPTFDINALIGEADSRLYLNKKRWHREND